MSIPRGIRNNNPLNIRRTGKDQWKGLSKTQSDRSFCQFETLEWGWRAAFYLLTRTYYHKYRLYVSISMADMISCRVCSLALTTTASPSYTT